VNGFVSELSGAAILAFALPWAVAVNTWGLYMIFTGKDTNSSKAVDSAEERRDMRWFVWPLSGSFVLTTVCIIVTFLSGDGSWFNGLN
jgi:hypothetical protein